MDMDSIGTTWTLIIIFGMAFGAMWLDGRIKDRAKQRNYAGRCARCEREISPLANEAAVAGGELIKFRAKLCNTCYEKAKKLDIVLIILIIVALILGVFLVWY
jgi:hypothetical protein